MASFDSEADYNETDLSFVNETDFFFNNETKDMFVNETIFRFGNKTVASFPKDMLGFTAACAFIIAVFGTFGNLLTIFALPMCRKLRTTATAFVINLAVVELLFCVVILPMSGAQYAYLQYTSTSLLSHRDCVYFAITRYTLTQCELQTIVAIALTRAVAVGFPSFYNKINTPVVTGVYIAGIWLYSFSMKLPSGLGYFGSYTFNPKTMECDNGTDPASRYMRFISLIVEAVVPVLVILILYIFIFVMVKKSTMRVERASSKARKCSASASSDEDRDGGGRKGSIASLKNLKRMMSETSLKEKLSRRPSATNCIGTSSRDMKVARTIFIIFIMVLVCSVPVAYIHAIDSEVRQPKRFLAVHILYWLQYCLNLVVYVLMNRQYRIAYVEFLSKLLPSWEQHKNFMFPWETPSVSSRQVGPNSSFKNRKDSSSQDPSATPQEYKPVETNLHQRFGPGRLSAIQEVTSTSTQSKDDVFMPEKSDDINASDASQDSERTYKFSDEKATADEKEHWVNQNGDTLHSPTKEDRV